MEKPSTIASGVKINAGSWKLTKKFSHHPIGKYQTRPAQEKILVLKLSSIVSIYSMVMVKIGRKKII